MRVTRSSCIPRMQKPKPVSKPEQARAASPEQDRFVPASGGAEDVPGLPAPVAYGVSGPGGETYMLHGAAESGSGIYEQPLPGFF